MKAEVTAVIPVWNRRELLERLLEKLRAQTHPLAEVLVVDNGSADGSAEFAESRGARVIRMGSNTGFSRAVNRGIDECRTEWLAIVNNDVEPAPDWLQRLVEATAGSGAWYATGKILSASHPQEIDGTYDVLCRGACAWRAGHGRDDGPEFSRSRDIWFAPATAALFRTALFRQLGGFDELFESYLEDVDFGLRCALAGYHGRYVPEALAWHQGSATLGKWHPDVARRIGRNQVLLVARHYPKRLLLRYGWAILVAQGLWGVVALRHGAGWAFVRGKVAGLRLCINRETARPRSGRKDLEEILTASECEIYHIQRETGFDWYWRLYFLLTGGGAN